MDGFWTCTDCGSVNPYPQITECEVCGKIIDSNEKKQAENALKDAKKSQTKIINEEKQQQLIKQKQEKRLKRNEILLQKEKTKNEIRLKRKKRFSLKNEKHYKFLIYFTKGFKIVRSFMILLVIAGVIIVGVSTIRQDNVEVIGNRFISIYEEVTYNFVNDHFYKNKSGDRQFKPLRNINRQYKYIKKQFKNSENINNLFESLGW